MITTILDLKTKSLSLLFMKLYYSASHYNPSQRRELFPLLKAFIKNKDFTDLERQSLYGVSERDFVMVESMNDAQIAILPMSWNYYTQSSQLDLAYEFIDEAKAKDKIVWSINTGDFGVKLTYFKNLTVFRQGGYTSNKQLGHVGLPLFVEDYIYKQNLEVSFLDSKYGSMPIVGFCGQTNPSITNALKDMAKQTLRNLRSKLGLSNLEPQKIIASTYIRSYLLNQLESESGVDCRFIKRKAYRAGVVKKEKLADKTTLEFFNNIFESQYVLCFRGAGNFSVRFYETLMMGRIPLYVHTDGYLPLSDVIDWKAHVVWVDYKDRHRISEILLDFHQQLDQESLITLFKKNRKLWEEKLTLSGFFTFLNN